MPPVLRLAVLPAAAGVAAILALPTPPPSTPRTDARARPAAAAPPGPRAPRDLPRAGEAPAAAAPAASAPGAPADPLDPVQVDEERVLATVRAIMKKRPMLAYRYLRQLETQFPGSPHAAERERYVIETLIELGRETEAKERAQAFLAEHPTGHHALRVQWFLDYPLAD